MRREDAPKKILVWDSETGGVDIASDRIFTAYAMLQSIEGETLKEWSWVIDPGVPMSPEAAAINGLTDEFIQANGMDSRKAINEIYMVLSNAVQRGIPIVGYNNAFDLGILSHEVRRHFNFDMADTIGKNGIFFDPFVYDVGNVKKRRGNRKLGTMCGHYGVPFDESEAHDAKYDVVKTNHLAWKMIKLSPYTLDEMQDLQLQWRQDYAHNLTDYFASVGKTNDDGSAIIVDDSFPWNRQKETV